VSSPASRAVVFEARAASDAVVVGGNTLRRDNPRLTTRRDSGHLPARIVMSRTLDLPDAANLWDTQARFGARRAALRARGGPPCLAARASVARCTACCQLPHAAPGHMRACARAAPTRLRRATTTNRRRRRSS
jgi:riboflavin biosynthesis pyrimidine reductase